MRSPRGILTAARWSGVSDRSTATSSPRVALQLCQQLVDAVAIAAGDFDSVPIVDAGGVIGRRWLLHPRRGAQPLRLAQIDRCEVRQQLAAVPAAFAVEHRLRPSRLWHVARFPRDRVRHGLHIDDMLIDGFRVHVPRSSLRNQSGRSRHSWAQALFICAVAGAAWPAGVPAGRRPSDSGISTSIAPRTPLAIVIAVKPALQPAAPADRALRCLPLERRLAGIQLRADVIPCKLEQGRTLLRAISTSAEGPLEL